MRSLYSLVSQLSWKHDGFTCELSGAQEPRASKLYDCKQSFPAELGIIYLDVFSYGGKDHKLSSVNHPSQIIMFIKWNNALKKWRKLESYHWTLLSLTKNNFILNSEWWVSFYFSKVNNNSKSEEVENWGRENFEWA